MRVFNRLEALKRYTNCTKGHATSTRPFRIRLLEGVRMASVGRPKRLSCYLSRMKGLREQINHLNQDACEYSRRVKPMGSA